MKGLSGIQAKVAFRILEILGHNMCATYDDIHFYQLADKVHELVTDNNVLFKGRPEHESNLS